MKAALLISFYDEIELVAETIKNFKKYCDGSIISIQSHQDSDSKSLRFIRSSSRRYSSLPNLADTPYHLSKMELPSAAVCRNYSKAFRHLDQLNIDADYIISILGDTLIYDWEKLMGYLEKVMVDKKAAVLQAIGQRFHDKDLAPEGRFQGEDTTDIMPQFFALKGITFGRIENTNKYTSEENLGNELLKHIDDFKTDVVRINTDATNAYSFGVGLKLQAG